MEVSLVAKRLASFGVPLSLLSTGSFPSSFDAVTSADLYVIVRFSLEALCNSLDTLLSSTPPSPHVDAIRRTFGSQGFLASPSLGTTLQDRLSQCTALAQAMTTASDLLMTYRHGAAGGEQASTTGAAHNASAQDGDDEEESVGDSEAAKISFKVDANQLLYPSAAVSKALLRSVCHRLALARECEASKRRRHATRDDDPNGSSDALAGLQKSGGVAERIRAGLLGLKQQANSHAERVEASKKGKATNAMLLSHAAGPVGASRGIGRLRAALPFRAAVWDGNDLAALSQASHDPASSNTPSWRPFAMLNTVLEDSAVDMVRNSSEFWSHRVAPILTDHANRRLASSRNAATAQQRLEALLTEGSTTAPPGWAQQTTTSVGVQPQGAAPHASFFGNLADVEDESHRSQRLAEEDAQRRHAEAMQLLEAAVAQRELDDAAVEQALTNAKADSRAMRGKIQQQRNDIERCEAEVVEFERRKERMQAEFARRRQRISEQRQLLALAGDPAALAALVTKAESLQRTIEEADAESARKLDKLNAKKFKLQTELEGLMATSTQADTVARLKSEVKELMKLGRAAAAETEALRSEWERCPKGIDRSTFLEAVQGMADGLARQQKEVDTALDQLAGVERSITRLQETSRDSFQRLESRLYNEASQRSKNDFLKESLALVVAIRDAYGKLVLAVRERGLVKKESFDADVRVAKLKRVVDQLQKSPMAADLQGVKTAIAALQEKIVAFQSRADV